MWVYLDGSMSPPDRKPAHPSEPAANPVSGDPHDLEPEKALGQDQDLDPILFPLPPPPTCSLGVPTIKPITGSAAVSAGRQSTFALVSSCPYSDSGDAEFWTLLTVLRHYAAHPPL